jgi:hypothetical protein
MQCMLFEIRVWVLHNLGMANSCDFQNRYCSVFTYLCVIKKTVEFIFKVKQQDHKVADCTYVS